VTIARRPPPDEVWQDVLTPEGVVLSFQVARAGDRAGAFLFDLMIQAGVTLVLWFALGVAGLLRAEYMQALGFLFFFLLRNFYFVYFEVRWQGATPGKRLSGLRVMDAHGGPLRTEAVFVRNVMREVEFWVPLTLLLAHGYLWPGAPGWARLLSCAWVFIFLLLPLFNRYRLRVGDLVAGTRVVVAPKAMLLADLGGQETHRAARNYRFTEAQLSIYGIYELQVLEDLLRQPKSVARSRALLAVSQRVRRKIKWDAGDVETERFLREFYAAQREHLERRMLLGRRKEDKYG